MPIGRNSRLTATNHQRSDLDFKLITNNYLTLKFDFQSREEPCEYSHISELISPSFLQLNVRTFREHCGKCQDVKGTSTIFPPKL
jgi:hypothetical protein